MNSAFWALGLKGDFVVESSKVSAFDENIAPKRATLVYSFPAKGKRAAVKIIWQDGVNDPNTDPDFVRPPDIPADLKLNEGFGQVFVAPRAPYSSMTHTAPLRPSFTRRPCAKKPGPSRKSIHA